MSLSWGSADEGSFVVVVFQLGFLGRISSQFRQGFVRKTPAAIRLARSDEGFPRPRACLKH